jgi:4-amino-4-deoxy-L-arabinose transferase-like glycosyltransferase
VIVAAATERRADRGLGLSLEETILAGVIFYFLALRALVTFVAPPLIDEPYYWLWGRHLALSYYDHPPLQGWVQGLSYALFGKTLFAMRWTTWLALAAELWVFLRVARRIGGEQWRPMFLRSAAVFLAMPIYGFFTGLAFHDHLLVALMMLSGYAFIVFFAEVEEGKRGSTATLLVAAALLGLAALTKYSGAFLGVAVALTVLLRPGLQVLLLDWRLYAAAALALAIQAPVIIWNAQHGFESILYQLGSRHGTTGFQGLNIGGIKTAVGNALIMASPFVVPVIFRFFWARGGGAFEQAGRTLAIWTFWPGALALLYIANFSWVMVWWGVTLYVLFVPFAGRYTRPILFGVHILWGAIVNTFASVSYSIVPVLLLLGNPTPGMETEAAYGWPRVAERVAALREQHDADFVAVNWAQSASELAWALNDPGVLAVSPQRNSFDDWTPADAHLGGTAIFVEQIYEGPGWKERFGKVTEIDRVPVEVWGHELRVYPIYLAEGFKGPQ